MSVFSGVTKSGSWVLGVVLAGSLCVGPAWAGEVVGRVGDWQVTADDLDKALVADIYELDQKRYELRAEKLQDMIEERLLDLEAKARKLTSEELFTAEVVKKAKPVTDKDVADFIEQRKERLPRKSEGLEQQVRRFMEAASMEEARRTFMVALAEKYHAETTLQEPVPPRFTVGMPADSVRGPADAPVTIVEFSDFECPYCRNAQATLRDLEKAYPGKLRMVFRHFPLEFHKQAPKASEASLCAGVQGKFWEFHDALFADADWLAPAKLPELAAKLGLDGGQFKNCLDGGKFSQRVTEDQAEGESLGITGTPTFFINGVKLVGNLPAAEFRKVIDAELAH
ncbi:MAG: thioredoxin domain-containing protein [Magnetococcus sp. WYHC-3]